MKFIRTTYIALVVMLLSIPGSAWAGVGDYFDRALGWWGAHSSSVEIYSQSEGPPAEPSEEPEEKEPVEEPDDDGNASSARRVRGMCVLAQEPSVTICELGSGFLCLNSPPGGVSSESVRIKGTIDRRSSVLASIRVAVQNEYTKKTVFLDTASIVDGENCWDDYSSDDSFCLERDGRFSVSIPLSDPGSYSISVTASRVSGEAVEKRVRLSRVIPLELKRENLEFSPDVTAMTSTDESHVMITADLLGECSFCDFIGASTGGVELIVENEIQDGDGSVRRIECSTTVEQGGQGRYVVGIPLENGTNRITVRACNAAVEGKCPSVEGINFIGRGGIGNLVMSSPPPQPSYDSSEWSTIPWKFRVEGAAECVGLQFNREPPTEICSDASGNYSIDLKPKNGINTATISLDGHTDNYAWSFGWGEIVSPFSGGDGSIDIPLAAQLAIPKRTVERILLPFANNFFSADEFNSMISTMLSGDSDDDSKASLPPSVNIPMCAGGGLGEFGFSLRGEPNIGNVELKYLKFGRDELDFSIVLDDTEVGLDLYPDENGDGNPDKDPLPLIINIRRAKIDLKLRVEGDGPETLILLDSPHDDCAFKRGSYCKHRPASLIPKNLAGGAYSYGGFIKCDVSKAGPQAKRACRAINTLDSQTGVVSEKVLDAINDAIYCGGSSMLTSMVRSGVTIPDLELGCDEDKECDDAISNILPNITIPIEVTLGDLLNISSKGLLANLGLNFGRENIYSATPSQFHIESVGIIAGLAKGEGSLKNPTASGHDLELALSLDALNAAIFVATVGGDGRGTKGLLDFNIHERFFKELGFDFVEECDKFEPIPGEKEESSTLCHLRPRVGELLGSSLTTYGYFDAKHPLLLAIRANRALSPRLEIVTIADLPVVERSGDDNPALGGGDGATDPTGELMALEIGGLELSFYDVELDDSVGVDRFGNPAVKYDADGEAVIKTMRPGEPDPWDGPIISFDLTLLLGLEINVFQDDGGNESGYVVSIRTLADRSRLVVTGMEGTNSTTVPDVGLISSLNEKLALGIAGMTPRDKAIKLSIPSEVALEAGEDGEFSILGLKTIALSDDGLAFTGDPKTNFIRAAVSAVITQLLHSGGDMVEYKIPN